MPKSHKLLCTYELHSLPLSEISLNFLGAFFNMFFFRNLLFDKLGLFYAA